MNVLVVKMSSLGDVVHTLPAITDACHAMPQLGLDWVVEAGFADICRQHPGVRKVIPIELRKWRKAPLAYRPEFKSFCKRLRETRYDLVLDAQGLIKSGFVDLLAKGPKGGFGRRAARESLVSLIYQHRVEPVAGLHAIEKTRQLFAGLLGYPVSDTEPDYGLGQGFQPAGPLLFLHGTTWASKHWPEQGWRRLAELASGAGQVVLLPHGNDAEYARAGRIADGLANVSVLPRQGLPELIGTMRGCRGVVTVDTGLGHLAAALNLPMIALFGPTNPDLTAPVGGTVRVLASDHLDCIPCLDRQCRQPQTGFYPPCFAPMNAERVFEGIESQIALRLHNEPG